MHNVVIKEPRVILLILELLPHLSDQLQVSTFGDSEEEFLVVKKYYVLIDFETVYNGSLPTVGKLQCTIVSCGVHN